MPKLISVTCLMLFWAFYEMSGGADFAPAPRQVISAAPWNASQPVPAEQIDNVQVAQLRSSSYVVLAASQAVELAPIAAAYTATEQVAEVEEPASVDLRIVAGSRVNMRNGPGTDHPILDTLSRGTQAEVLAINGDGWAQVRLIENGNTGVDGRASVE